MSHYPPLGPQGTSPSLRHPYYFQGAGEHDDEIAQEEEEDAFNEVDEIQYERRKRAKISHDGAHRATGRPIDEDQDQESMLLDQLAQFDANSVGVDQDFQPLSGEESPDAHQLSPSPDVSGYGGRGGPSRRGRKRGARNRGGSRGRGRPKATPYFSSRSRNPDAPPRGERHRGRKTGRRGPRVADPEQQYKTLQTQATTAYLDYRYEEAANLCLEAIRVNPEIFASYGMLSDIYDAWGKPREAHDILWDGAYLQNDAELWRKLVDTMLAYTDEEYGPGRKDCILRCYSEMIKQNPGDLDARRGRLELYIERDSHTKAVNECVAMLEINPYDLVALQSLGPSSIEENIPSVALTAYRRALDHFQSDDFAQTAVDIAEDDQFSLSDLNDYAELFMRQEQYEDGIREMKSVARWLMGRADEKYWDEWTSDDREWDEPDHPRRSAVPEYRQGAYPTTAYGEGLPMELRAKLGIFRLKLEHTDEAMVLFEYFAPEARGIGSPILDYAEQFRDIGNALFHASHYEIALRFYEALNEEQPAYRQPGIQRSMAVAYSACDNDDLAILFYKRVVERMPGSFADGIELTRLYEKHNRTEEALAQVREMLQRGAHKDVKASGVQCGKLMQQIKPPPKRPYHRKSRLPPVDASWGEGGPVADLLEVVERATTTPGQKAKFRSLGYPQLRRLFGRLVELSTSVREEADEDATDEYLKICEVLVDQFAQAQLVYTGSELKPYQTWAVSSRRLGSTSYIKEAQPLLRNDHNEITESDHVRPSSEIISEHACISFEQWLDVHCEYALLLAKREYREEAFAVLDLAEGSKIFGQDDLCVQRIHICHLACAMACEDEERATVGLRWFVARYGQASDVWRVYNLFSLWYPNPPNWYNAGPAQKYWMRMVKYLDFSLMSDKQRRDFSFSAQEKSYAVRAPLNLNKIPNARYGNPQGLTSLDPSLLIFYGHLLTQNGSYSNALQYFLRAYAIAPTAPLTLFSIATAYIQLAMKRIAVNRHYSILLGWAFFGEYKRQRLRGVRKGGRVWRQRRMEVAYNEARAWHYLGLAHLALPRYERCLALAIGEEVPDEIDDEGLKKDDDQGPSTNDENRGKDADITDTDTAQINGANRAGAAEKENEDESKLRDEPDYTRESAVALQQMMVLAGNEKEARRIGERWLVF